MSVTTTPEIEGEPVYRRIFAQNLQSAAVVISKKLISSEIIIGKYCKQWVVDDPDGNDYILVMRIPK